MNLGVDSFNTERLKTTVIPPRTYQGRCGLFSTVADATMGRFNVPFQSIKFTKSLPLQSWSTGGNLTLGLSCSERSYAGSRIDQRSPFGNSPIRAKSLRFVKIVDEDGIGGSPVTSPTAKSTSLLFNA